MDSMCLRRHADACHFICICIYFLYFLYFLYCRPCGQARAWADMLTLVIASARHSQKKMGQPAIYRSGLVLYLYSVFCICIRYLFFGICILYLYSVFVFCICIPYLYSVFVFCIFILYLYSVFVFRICILYLYLHLRRLDRGRRK